MSTAYSFNNGAFKAEDFELLNGMAPAGSLSSCAVDMAQFMIAHLQNGRFGDTRILKEETAQFMHSRLYGHDAHVAGNAHGFWEININDQHIIEHGGDTIYFHSQLALIPAQNLGYFVSFNTAPGAARDQLFDAFMDRYYPAAHPAPAPEVKALPDAAARLGKLVGSYGTTRHSYKTYEKLAAMMMAFKVTSSNDGTIFITLPEALGGGRQYVETEPWVFRQLGGRDVLVFKLEPDGRVKYAFNDGIPHMALVKLAWYEMPTFNYFLIGLCVFLFLTAFLGWPLAAFSRVLCRRKCEGVKGPKAARWLAGIMGLLFVLFLVLVFSAISDQKALMAGVPAMLKIALGFPLMAAVLALGVLFFVIKAWQKKYWTRCHRLHYTLVFLAALAFLWFLNNWNLLGWRF
jgi:hypothetical protein